MTTTSEALEHVAQGIEVLGAFILILGFAWSVGLAVRAWRRTASGRSGFETLRRSFGAVLLLSLEVLVAADLILTVAVEQTLESVAVLGLIVVIRTFLSFSLEIEIEGVLPWRRALVTGPAMVAQVARQGRDVPGGATSQPE